MSEAIKQMRYFALGFTNIFAPLDKISDTKELGEITKKINNARLANRKKHEQEANKTNTKKD